MWPQRNTKAIPTNLKPTATAGIEKYLVAQPGGGGDPGMGATRGEQGGEGVAGVQRTESSSNWSKPIAHSLAPLSLAGSRGLFWEALHTACHFPARLTRSKTKPAQQQPYVNRVGGEEALNSPEQNSRNGRKLGEVGGAQSLPP